jgi:hypothetical protein
MGDRNGRAREQGARFIGHRTTDIGAERLAERWQCNEQRHTRESCTSHEADISVLSSKSRFPGGGKR